MFTQEEKLVIVIMTIKHQAAFQLNALKMRLETTEIVFKFNLRLTFSRNR